MFQFNALSLDGAFLVTLPEFADDRGTFVKVFQNRFFENAGIEFELKESYFSFSKKGVIRGMHFQNPPFDHSKVVYCPSGAILDVIVDLRSHSATFGQYLSRELSRENHKAFFIPKGFAHGFKALTEDAMTCYLVSSEYHKDNDTGIRYDSFGFDWEQPGAIISQRDLSFPTLQDWKTVF